MKRFRIIILLVCIGLIVLIMGGCAVTGTSSFGAPADSAQENRGEDTFTLQVLDVGQGLCVLICADGHYAIYDGGGKNYTSYVVAYLKQHGVKSLDYLISSHYDEDHLNGLIGVLACFPVDTALMPDYETDSDTFRSFRKRLEENGALKICPAVGEVYPLGEATIRILGPESYDSEVENNRSVAVRIDYGKTSCILTGDARSEEEGDILASGADVDTDVYVAGHHGSASSSSYAFVSAMSPKYVLVSVGKDNPYGHPDEEALDTFAVCGAAVCRTDHDGALTAHSDGKSLWLTKEIQQEAEKNRDANSLKRVTLEDLPEGAYVLNIRSKKIHRPDCENVLTMYRKNMLISEETKEELITEGFTPCKHCRP